MNLQGSVRVDSGRANPAGRLGIAGSAHITYDSKLRRDNGSTLDAIEKEQDERLMATIKRFHKWRRKFPCIRTVVDLRKGGDHA